jgi:hypothetical protein
VLIRALLPRLKRAFALEASLFEEVEHDHHAGAQAMLVVVVASACAGAGNAAAARLLGVREATAGAALVLALFFLVAWLAWSFLTMSVGTMAFGGRADMGEMQRALGFAAAPGMLMLVPGLGALVGVPWSCVAMVIAVRQALDFTTRKALLTVAVSSLVVLVVLGALGGIAARFTFGTR